MKRLITRGSTLLAAAAIDTIAAARAIYNVKKAQWTNHSKKILLTYGKKPDGLTLWHNAAVNRAEDIVHWDRLRIRQFFESYGLLIQEWDRVRTDWLTLRPALVDAGSAPGSPVKKVPGDLTLQ